MPRKFNPEPLLYAAVIVLFLIILALLLAAPPEFADIRNAYQGF